MRKLSKEDQEVINNLLDELLDEDGEPVGMLGVSHGLAGRDMTDKEFCLVTEILLDCVTEE